MVPYSPRRRIHDLPSVPCRDPDRVGAAASTSRLLAIPPYSAWSPAVNLGSPINSPFTETGATLSKHGLSLYFSSNRPCDQTDAVADFNLWVAHRNSRKTPWGEPECLPINADARILGDPSIRTENPRSRGSALALFRERPSRQSGPACAYGRRHLGKLASEHLRRPRMDRAVNVTGLNTEVERALPSILRTMSRASRSCSFRARARILRHLGCRCRERLRRRSRKPRE